MGWYSRLVAGCVEGWWAFVRKDLREVVVWKTPRRNYPLTAILRHPPPPSRHSICGRAFAETKVGFSVFGLKRNRLKASST